MRVSFVPRGSASTSFAISSTLRPRTSLPHVTQCWRPARASTAQVVVELRDRCRWSSAGSRTRSFVWMAMVGEEAAQAFDRGTIESRPRNWRAASGEGLHVTTLTFGVERVEREAALAGAARTRQHDEGIFRKDESVDLQIVFTRTDDLDDVAGAHFG